MRSIPKNLGILWLKKKHIFFETEIEQLPKHSEDGQNEGLKILTQ